MKKKITPEEASMPITLDRLHAWMNEAGEDFCDQNEMIGKPDVFGGFLLAKHPDWATELIDKLNSKYKNIHMFEEVFEDKLGYDNYMDIFYTEYAEFLNLTVHSKKAANIILLGYPAED